MKFNVNEFEKTTITTAVDRSEVNKKGAVAAALTEAVNLVTAEGTTVEAVAVIVAPVEVISTSEDVVFSKENKTLPRVNAFAIDADGNSLITYNLTYVTKGTVPTLAFLPARAAQQGESALYFAEEEGRTTMDKQNLQASSRLANAAINVLKEDDELLEQARKMVDEIKAIEVNPLSKAVILNKDEIKDETATAKEIEAVFNQ